MLYSYGRLYNADSCRANFPFAANVTVHRATTNDVDFRIRAARGSARATVCYIRSRQADGSRPPNMMAKTTIIVSSILKCITYGNRRIRTDRIPSASTLPCSGRSTMRSSAALHSYRNSPSSPSLRSSYHLAASSKSPTTSGRKRRTYVIWCSFEGDSKPGPR